MSLPKPGKLGNRWGAAVAAERQERDNESSTTAPAFGNKPAIASVPVTSFNRPFTGNTGAGTTKPLTWSERQALAKKQREEEDAASLQASVEQSKTPSSSVPAAISAPAPIVSSGGLGGAKLPTRPGFSDDEDDDRKSADDFDDVSSAPICLL